jgi:chromate reductase
VIRLVGISGSLRKHSYNTGLLHAAAEAMPDGVLFELVSIAGIPLYNADVEAAEGLPEAVVRLKAAIAGADGVLIATPEYNNGIPGVFKNAIDWASRPAVTSRLCLAGVRLR